jgi:general secretion pathway protein D
MNAAPLCGARRLSPGNRRLSGPVAMLCGLSLWAGATLVHAQAVTLNLNNADIAALIDTVAEITGRNFIVDPRVKGEVTVISSTPMSDVEVYEIFLQILKVHGFTAVDTGKAVQIIPLQDAKTDSTFANGAGAGAPGEEIVTRVIPVRNMAAAQLIPVLRPLVPQAGHLAASPASNVIVITDRAVNAERMARIIERIDVVQESDIDVVALTHASATEVARIVSGLIEQPAAGAEGGVINRPKLMADERTNSVLIHGEREARQRLRAIVSNLDTPKVVGGGTQVIYLRHANAEDLVGVLQGVVDSMQPEQKAGTEAPGVRTTIQSDKTVNALIITAPPDITAALQEVIAKLDIRRKQVLVEALIAEVSTDKAAELGVQWRSTTSPDEEGAFGGTNFNLTGQGINRLSANPSAVGDGLSLGFIDGSVTALGTEILNLGALIRALAADSDANILSTPSLVTLDNEEATIVVGQNVPFITGQYTVTGANQGAANPFQTIEREDVGITLRVRPQINEGNAIRLEIAQEVSSISLATTTSNAADIITDKRSINTSVLVDDGELVVLGGLIEDNLREDHQRVPLLGSIPVLGRLFRYERTEAVKTNLMVFLTPSILKDSVAHAEATSTHYDRLRNLQLERKTEGVQLIPEAEQPVIGPRPAPSP